VSALLEKKKVTAEMDVAAPLPRLNEFIEAELDRLEGFSKEGMPGSHHMDAASALFRALVRDGWEPNSALPPTAASDRG
jgi:hypothetical protein